MQKDRCILLVLTDVLGGELRDGSSLRGCEVHCDRSSRCLCTWRSDRAFSLLSPPTGGAGNSRTGPNSQIMGPRPSNRATIRALLPAYCRVSRFRFQPARRGVSRRHNLLCPANGQRLCLWSSQKVTVDAEVNEVLDVLVVPQTQLLLVGSSGARVTTLSCELIVENLVVTRLAENACTHDRSRTSQEMHRVSCPQRYLGLL